MTQEKLRIISSRYLFQSLCMLSKVQLICDVGSFDGTDAKTFAKSGARVVALEAHPKNAAAMMNDPEIRSASIQVFNLAAWNEDGFVGFHSIDALAGRRPAEWLQMIGSVRARSEDAETSEVAIPATRLDTFVAGLSGPRPESIAFWIDVEGAGYEVLEGMERICDQVCVIHVETELAEFWQGQRLWPELAGLMKRLGFTPLGQRPGDLQFDVVFVNDELLAAFPIRVRWCVLKAWLRLKLGMALGRARRTLSALSARTRQKH